LLENLKYGLYKIIPA
jgi:hypothetical protein